MDKTYQKLLRLGIDLAPVGIERSDDAVPYFCTPKGASIFGWAGVDGIHFCFIRGFGGMVFSVSPMNGAPDYVHPLAKDFADFLRLLIACGDAAALEQAWQWDEAQFDDFLRENPSTQQQKQLLCAVAEKFRLAAMDRPWKYVRDLQSAFDYSKIKYTEDFYDMDMNPSVNPAPQEWKVYFDGNFGGHHGRDHAGTEITLESRFEWAGRRFVVPAAYSCSKGLVVDFCMRVDPEDIRGFMKKWNLSPDHDSSENFSREQQMKMEFDNPLAFEFRPCLEVNGKILRSSHGCSVCFNPCMSDEISNDLEAKRVTTHYELDSSYGWVVCRNSFPWAGRRPPEIRRILLTMEEEPNRLPGPHFKPHGPGDSFTFSHPISGTEYTLTVQELERQTLQSEGVRSDRWVYPAHMVAMSYTISPETAEKMTVCDCSDGDRPLEIAPKDDSLYPSAGSDAAVVAIIGGSDGPTAFIAGDKRQGKPCVAYSSLHFDPVDGDVEWRVDFIANQFEEKTFSLK